MSSPQGVAVDRSRSPDLQSLITTGRGSDTLMAVFNSWGSPFDGDKTEWEMLRWTSGLPVDTVRFAERGPGQGWYADKTKRIFGVLDALLTSGGYRTLILVGLSSGGYASLLFGELIGRRHREVQVRTFAINPQTVLSLPSRGYVWASFDPTWWPPMVEEYVLQNHDYIIVDLPELMGGLQLVDNLQHVLYYDEVNLVERHYAELVGVCRRLSPVPLSIGLPHIPSSEAIYWSGVMHRDVERLIFGPEHAGRQPGPDAAVHAVLDHSAETVSWRDREAIERAAAALKPGAGAIAALSASHNHVLMYGQSLACGSEAWPAKTLTSIPDVLMLGHSVRPGGNAGAAHVGPLGDHVLRPAVSTVQDLVTGDALSAAEQAALPPNADQIGEELLVSGLQFASILRAEAVDDAPRTRIVATNVAVPGKGVEHLSKDHEYRLFERVRGMSAAVKTAVQAEGGVYAVAALMFVQGEFNYAGAFGASTDKEAYKHHLRRLYRDFVDDIAVGTAEQSAAPAMILAQTGGAWTTDETDLSIGMAQWELSLEEPGWFLAAPTYPVTSKIGHLDANGSRWLSLQLGKVFHRTVVQRRGWRPLSPIGARVLGRTVLIDFHVPEPPLQFRAVYQGFEPVMHRDKGFTVIDDEGPVRLSAVTLPGRALVALTLSRPLSGAAHVYYARREPFIGTGNLCDSDPTVSPFVYEYEAESGDYPQADLPLFVGRPYPLWNWCIAFKLPIVLEG